MNDRYRAAAQLGVMTLLLFCSVTVAESQMIRGRVVDAGTSIGVEGAVVLAAANQRTIATVLSDSLEGFLLRLPDSGIFSVHAERIGYLDSESAELRLEMGAEIDIQITLQPDAVPVDEVVATGVRGSRLPSAASIEGLHARRAVLARVGSRRVFVAGDPEMLSVTTVGQSLERWIPFGGERRCVDWFVNGYPMPPLSQPREFVREMATSMLEGIEYYRDEYSAPLELQGQGWCKLTVAGMSLIAIWFRQ